LGIRHHQGTDPQQVTPNGPVPAPFVADFIGAMVQEQGHNHQRPAQDPNTNGQSIRGTLVADGHVSVEARGALGTQQAFGARNATVQVRRRLVVVAKSNVVTTAIVDVGASFKQTRVPRHSPKTLQWTDISPHGGAQTTERWVRVD